MTPLCVLAAGLVLLLPCAAEWTQAQKEWALGTAAVLAQVNGDRYDLLGGADPVSRIEAQDQQKLAQSWGIHSHTELLETVHELVDGKIGRAEVAWNYSRAVNLV